MSATPDLDALVEKTRQALHARRRLPEATYRLQFNAQFTFRDAAALVPYLHDLGITDCYASPYLQARPGSMHGYDVFNHNALNPEIGSPDDYDNFVRALHERSMGQVLDVVPNHMGIAGNDNRWWNDVLENGPSSPYAGFFDIDWYSSLKPEVHEKVLLPVLGDPYGKALESGQLCVHYEGGCFAVHYYDRRFPIDPGTYGRILSLRLPELEQRLDGATEALIEYQSILTAIAHLPPRFATDPAQTAERSREKEVIKRRLAALAQADARVRGLIEENVALLNGQPGNPRSFDLLDDLLNDQAYRLAFWRVAADEINYRRFFDVNDLAALSMEKPEVFEATHALILRLLREGKVNGIRVDHPDGLYDPRGYLKRLQVRYVVEVARDIFAHDPQFAGRDWREVEGPLTERLQAAAEGMDAPFARPLYLVVEKILGRGEALPDDWPVHGTTGYEFLNAINGLFVRPDHASVFTRIYQRWGSEDAFADIVYRKKFLIMQVALSAELHVLAHQLNRLSERDRWSRDFTLNSLRHALREVIACFPVYRPYIVGESVHPRDRRYVEWAVARAKRRNPAISESIFDFVRDMLLMKYPEAMGEEDREALQRFVGKFQQVTSPVMAKGLEDTAFYVYNRLVSLNEVGGDPETFGIPVSAFHRQNRERQERFPCALSTTATHDTKRGEDVRTTIDVLSEMPQEWRRALTRWSRLNKRHRIEREDLVAPDRNDEYFFYQTLLGAWPLEPFEGKAVAEFTERIQAYMQKATHEAKVHTSWINPNPAYDDGIRAFVAGVLDPAGNAVFLQDFQDFQRTIRHYGLLNSLSQTLLKITSPGVPDVYQGTELWDFSLVDPDNRRPVDYERRRQMLTDLKREIQEAESDLPSLARRLVETKEDGRVKLYVVWRALQCRREGPGLFREGAYLPIETTGARRDHLCGFVRQKEGRSAVVVVPRLLASLLPQPGALPLGRDAWDDTRLLLPGLAPRTRLRDVFTGVERVAADENGQAVLDAADALAHFPLALLLTV